MVNLNVDRVKNIAEIKACMCEMMAHVMIKNVSQAKQDYHLKMGNQYQCQNFKSEIVSKQVCLFHVNSNKILSN